MVPKKLWDSPHDNQTMKSIFRDFMASSLLGNSKVTDLIGKMSVWGSKLSRLAREATEAPALPP